MLLRSSINYERHLKDKLLELSAYVNVDSSCKIDPSFLREYYYKFYAQTLVYNFYVEKQDNFVEYVDSLSKEYLHSFKVPTSFVSAVLSQVFDDAKKLNLQNEVVPLGDVHYKGGTKYLNNKKISFHNYPNYDTLVRTIADIVNVIPVSCLPLQNNESGALSREFIDVNNVTDDEKKVEEYFYNLGVVIPFLLLLRAIDVYAENILVNLPYPVLFDLECIFTGVHEKDPNYSLFHTGIIKVPENNDVSALTGGMEQIYSYLHPSLHNENGLPKIKWKIKSDLKADNLVLLRGNYVDVTKYIDILLKGFDCSSNQISKRMADVRKAVLEIPTYIRYIHRPTYIYSSRIQHYLFPNVYETQDSIKFMREGLQSHSPMFAVTESEGILNYESESMSKGMVPVFYNEIHSNDVFNSNGDLITKNKVKPVDVWLSHITNIEEFFYKQRKILRDSI